MGLALHNYESSNGAFPPAGQGTNFSVSPARTQFVDGEWGVLARILPGLEQNSAYNALNFSLPYSDIYGANMTGAGTVISTYICPSSVRDQTDGRDAFPDPAITGFTQPFGYGVQDYGATCYTDIDPQGQRGLTGSTAATPFRNDFSRADGMLKAFKTAISEVRDGTSNTIMIAEDAGRDATFIANAKTSSITPLDIQYDNTLPRRFWRWAEPDGTFGVSGQINNSFRPASETVPYQSLANARARNNNAFNNDEIASFHPGGANVVLGDGSVRFLKETTNVVILRSLITPKGGEVISADQY